MLIVKLALELQLGLPFCIYYVFTKPNSTLLMRYSYCHVGWHINRGFQTSRCTGIPIATAIKKWLFSWKWQCERSCDHLH